MIISAKVYDEWFIVRLDNAPMAYREALMETMTNVSQYLYDKIYAKLSGDAIQVKSGRLRDALKEDVFVEAEKIIARVRIEGVPYAAIQERGGTTRPHMIIPREADVLRFEIGNTSVFTTRVRHPGSKIRETMYMRSVLMYERTKINKMMRDTVKNAEARLD